MFAACRECPDCGYTFPPSEPSHGAKASSSTVMTVDGKMVLSVDDIEFHLHKKAGSPDSVKVAYKCENKTIYEWICPEHQGYAQRVAEKKLSTRWGLPCMSTEDVIYKLEQTDVMPEKIIVKKSEHNPKFFEVLGWSKERRERMTIDFEDDMPI